MPLGRKDSTHVVLDFTRRTKGARRERLGLAGELATALRPHYDEVTVVYPKDEAPPPKCQAAKAVGVDSRSDVFYEEVILPFLLKRWRATHLFTFRETLALPSGVYGHLHLHEDPYPRKSLERRLRSKRSVKVAIAEWRNARRYPSFLHRIGSLTTSSEWTLERLKMGPMGNLRAVQQASVAYLGGFEDAESRTIPRSFEDRSHVLISGSNDPRDDLSWALDVYEGAITGVALQPPPAIVFGTSTVGARHVKGRVECIGFIGDDTRLLELYRTALAYIHPASFEGFGLMPLEAMQCGTPVLAPAGSSNAEAVGDGAYSSSTAAAANLQTILQDRSKWELASARAWERGKGFQWNKCAATIATTMTAFA
jgi:glycosyltransferase involved in cell wall biosynthesis